MAKDSTYYKVQANGSSTEADIFLYGEIGDWWEWEQPLTDIDFVREINNLVQNYARVNVHLNSVGGSVAHGNAIVNAIKANRDKVHTYCDGVSYSMAAVIWAAADKDKRHIAANGMLMFHSPSTWGRGNAEDFRDMAEMLDKVGETLAVVVAGAAGKDVEDINKELFDGKDHFFTASEAVDYGFVDAIEAYEAENMPNNIRNMTFEQVRAWYQEKEEKQGKKGIFNFLNKFRVSGKGKETDPVVEEPVLDMSKIDDIIIAIKNGDLDKDALLNALNKKEETPTALTKEDIADLVAKAIKDALPKQEEPTPTPEEAAEAKRKELEDTIAKLQDEVKALGEAPGAEETLPNGGGKGSDDGSEVVDQWHKKEHWMNQHAKDELGL